MEKKVKNRDNISPIPVFFAWTGSLKFDEDESLVPVVGSRDGHER